MVSNDPRSLSDWIERAYEILVSRITTVNHGLSREQAQSVLVDHDEFPNEVADTTHAINRLLDTGWLYEVNDELRITETDEEDDYRGP